MFRIFVAAMTMVCLGTMLPAQETPSGTGGGDEAAEWAALQQDGSSADVFAFIERHPDGAFANEAKAYMIDLLWTELADGPPPATTQNASAEVFDPVTFTGPLTQGAPEVVGKSLAELIKGHPLFPPVEGLPEEYWKAQECSSCHEWEQTNLCVQANTYLTDAGAENLIKKHPYGGTFKLNLRTWATGGCQ